MERQANYAAVGAFIVLVIAMAVVFVLWYSEASDGREYDRYEIYFTGSVSGLSRGSPVRYLGVDVGRVRQLTIDRSDAKRVEVVAEVDRSAPISSATRASLELQGVTGLLYINLKEVPASQKSAALPRGRRYPVIESVASDFDVLLESMPELVSRAIVLLERMGRVVADENLTALAQTLQNLHAASQGLPATARNLSGLLEELRSTVGQINAASTALNAMVEEVRPDIGAALSRLSAAAGSLAQAAARMDQFTRNSEVQLGHFSEQGLFELERLLREAQSATQAVRDLARSLQENPSQVLYEPPSSGVEIDP